MAGWVIEDNEEVAEDPIDFYYVSYAWRKKDEVNWRYANDVVDTFPPLKFVGLNEEFHNKNYVLLNFYDIDEEQYDKMKGQF